MNKENSDFLRKISQGINESNQRQIQRENVKTDEIKSRELSEKTKEQNHLKKVDQTEQEFTKLGVVAAFEELIKNNFIFIKKENIEEYEKKYNFWGKVIDSRKIEHTHITPSYIQFDENKISLVVKEHWSTYPYGPHEDEKYVSGRDSIDVIKLENYKYKIDLHNDRFNTLKDFIKPSIVNEEDILDNLVKIIVVYKELSILENQNSYDFQYDKNHRESFPKFP